MVSIKFRRRLNSQIAPRSLCTALIVGTIASCGLAFGNSVLQSGVCRGALSSHCGAFGEWELFCICSVQACICNCECNRCVVGVGTRDMILQSKISVFSILCWHIAWQSYQRWHLWQTGQSKAQPYITRTFQTKKL